MKLRAMSVSEINQYIHRTLKFDPILSGALIVGEISNFKRHSSGHLYFSLKDENAKISCVMFRSQANLLDYQPQEGEKTEIRGSIGVYEKDGRYQVYVDQMAPIGQGELFKAFLALKSKLEKANYFTKQRSIMPIPKTIGIVTSPTSAALQDMLKVIKRRNPLTEVKIFPVHVQGERAAGEIAFGIDYFNEHPVDTIIIGRGGGSLEELWAFNELEVAEAIYASEIPIISAVGHETDFSISDFVADYRAATPSEAAELVISPISEYIEKLETQKLSLINSVERKVETYKLKLLLATPERLSSLVDLQLKHKYQQALHTYSLMDLRLNNLIEQKKNALKMNGIKLHSFSPFATLERGYGIIEHEGQTITDTSEVLIGDSIDIILKNGIINTEVVSKKGLKIEKK